jgi:glucose-6-phosphate isomerase
LSSFYPQFQYFIEWWKQLYAESEGKEHRGIFPSGAVFSTDLHSIGQYIQDGLRILFETFITISKENETKVVETEQSNADGLNYLAGKSLEYIQKQAEKATMLAHNQGGVPIIEIELQELNEYCLGQLLYFFEFACAISGYFIEVNPFDQPGVEQYKNNMFALLGKPGVEEDTKRLRKMVFGE